MLRFDKALQKRANENSMILSMYNLSSNSNPVRFELFKDDYQPWGNIADLWNMELDWIISIS